MCNFATSVLSSLFYAKNWHADLEFACKFCFLVSYNFKLEGTDMNFNYVSCWRSSHYLRYHILYIFFFYSKTRCYGSNVTWYVSY